MFVMLITDAMQTDWFVESRHAVRRGKQKDSQLL